MTISASSLAGQTLRVGFRRGGESLRPKGRRETHTLKHLLQEAGVPPWQRERIPLLWRGDELLAVVGYWLNDEFCAKAGMPGMTPVLRENPPGNR